MLNQGLIGVSRITCTVAAFAFLAGCGGGNDGPKVYSLESGIYEFSPETYDPNTCWTPEQGFPPPIDLQLAVQSNQDGSIIISGNGVSEGLIPDIPGNFDGNTLSAGPDSFELDATDAEEADPDYTGAAGAGDCTVTFSATASGTMTANNEFDLALPITVSDKVGTGCSELAGDTLDLGGFPVPFPDLSTGSCQLQANGHTVKLAE